MRKAKHRGGKRPSIVVVVSLLAAFAGCAAGTDARLQRSQQVLNDFMSARVLPDHRYYTTGPQNSPNAILGVAADYTLVSDRWAQQEMTPELLRHLVGSMNAEFLSPVTGLLGAEVRGQKGEQIGVWYSGVAITVVEMLDDGSVRIDPPLTAAIQRLRTPD